MLGFKVSFPTISKTNAIRFIVVVSIVLLSTDLIYDQVVNGQNITTKLNPAPPATHACATVELSNLVVIDTTCESYTDALNQYLMQGYELKLSNKGLFYLTK
jgi:hypothetical protein